LEFAALPRPPLNVGGQENLPAGGQRRLVLIRRETDADATAVDIVHLGAFARPGTGGGPPEVDLGRRLRGDAGWVPALSLVAERTTGAVVGHVVCTVGSVVDREALGLGPLGVLPAYQRRGVGQALMHAVLGAADALEFPVVALLGHVDYYARFGLVAARSIGVIPPDPAWDDHFQARRLHTWNSALGGVFKYAAPFDDL
jgi:putative acetyltransferase